MKSITIINPQNSNRFEKSHNLVDIIFWKKYFRTKKDYKARFYSQKCEEFTKDKNHYFFKTSFKNETINQFFILLCAPKSHSYLLQSYYEPSVILWLLFSAFFKKKVYLVATNNISEKRIKKPLIRLFYNILKLFKVVIFVHSDFEKKLLSSAFPTSLIKIKNYHLWDEILDIDKSFKSREKNHLIYPGPIKRDKPVKYFNSFLKSKATSHKIQSLTLMNCRKSDFNFIVDFKSNEVFNSEYSELSREFSKAQYIFLPHDKSFTGKLSGNLLDAISFGLIPISNDIQPIRQFFEEYGDFGIILDYDNENWIKELELELNNLDIEKCQHNLESIRQRHTQNAIFKTLDEIF